MAWRVIVLDSIQGRDSQREFTLEVQYLSLPFVVPGQVKLPEIPERSMVGL